MFKEPDRHVGYVPYPRALYLAGDVAQKIIFVNGAAEEAEQRKAGYLAPWEKPVVSLTVTDQGMEVVKAIDASAQEPVLQLPEDEAPAKRQYTKRK